ncbi:MAG: Arm DNA-binding domain-containing protein [bacterium]
MAGGTWGVRFGGISLPVGVRDQFAVSKEHRTSLTDTAIKNAKPGTKPVKLSDGSGLFLLLTPEGGRRWRHR